MPLGRCNDCGGAAHPYRVYEWIGAPKLRDAICPTHRTQLDRTTRPQDKARVVQVSGARVRRPRERTI